MALTMPARRGDGVFSARSSCRVFMQCPAQAQAQVRTLADRVRLLHDTTVRSTLVVP
jgi:hypothetical protein